MKRLFALSLAVLLLLSSCFTVGDTITYKYSKLSNDTCSVKAPKVELYFENELLPFTYSKVGIIEVQSGEYTPNETLFDYLKYYAWSNCGNAVINIKMNYIDRETGLITAKKEELRTYKATIMTGIVVKKNTNAIQQLDTNFIQTVRTENAKNRDKASGQLGLTLASTVIGLVIGFAVIATKDK
jgi:hypothetical protein